MSNTDGHAPEPGDEPALVPSADSFAALQMQMSQMMSMMQANTANTDQSIANILAEQELQRGVSVGGTALNTPRMTGRRDSKGDLTQTVPSPAFRLSRQMPRRDTAFFGVADGTLTRKDAPKCLTDGSCFGKMKKFAGKSTESIQEHFLTFEYLARTTNQQWWCDCLQETFSPVITTAIINKGLTLRAGRDRQGTCPAGWYDYDELKDWLSKKYHRAQYHLELLCKVFYGYKQTGSLDAYITLVDQKLACCEIDIHDDLRKIIVLEHMDPETKKVIVARPGTVAHTNRPMKNFAKLQFLSMTHSLRPKRKLLLCLRNSP